MRIIGGLILMIVIKTGNYYFTLTDFSMLYCYLNIVFVLSTQVGVVLFCGWTHPALQLCGSPEVALSVN